MRSFLFLALLGCALALQGPVEYRYLYEARIGTGVHSARPQFAATGIKANVKLTVQSDGSVDIQAENVKVGEGNRELQHEGREPLAIDYKDIEDKAIEKPFKAYLRKHDGETVMEVPESDLLWVTNVRRGMANIFRIAPLIDPSSVPPVQPGHQHFIAFSKIQDTFAGRCKVQYTVTPVDPTNQPMPIPADIQSRRTPKGPGGVQNKLAEEYSMVQTSIDFSSCSERVFLGHTGAGNLTNVTSSTFRDVSSRTHVGHYILKGEPGKYRLESGVVESVVLYQPYGIDSDKALVMSNQTVTLLSARQASRAVRSYESRKEIKTWHHQVLSPHAKPQGYSPRFIVYSNEGEPENSPVFYERLSSGFKFIDDSMQETFKKRILEALRIASDRFNLQNEERKAEPRKYTGTEDGRMAQALKDVQVVMRSLTEKHLRELDSQLKRQKDSCKLCHELFIELLGAAGTGASINLLIEKIRNHELSDNRTASIFFNMPNNIRSPLPLEKLVDLAISVSEERNSTASLLIKPNVAMMIRRLCINPDTKTYSHMRYMFGNMMCNRDKIVEKYVKALEEKIMNAKDIWVKILNVITLGDIGAKECLPTLEKVVKGEVDRDIFLRYSAARVMSAENFDNTTSDRIFNILQPIAESRVTDYRIRQIAYDSLLTFKPNSTFIQRIIFSSHYEPSEQMQSYYSWLTDSLAKINDPTYQHIASAARNSLPLAKYAPSSMYRPAMYLYSRYIHSSLIGSSGEVDWLVQLKESFPRDIYAFLSAKFGRFSIPLIETVTFGNTQLPMLSLRNYVEAERGRCKSDEECRRQRQLQDEYLYGGCPCTEESGGCPCHGRKKRPDKDHRRRSQRSLFPMSEDESSSEDLSGEDMLESSQNRIRMQSYEEESTPDLYHFSRLWRTSEVFLPLSNQIYDELPKMLKRIRGSERVLFHKYLNPVEVSVILPTAPGLFAKIELTTPTILSADAEVTAKVHHKSAEVPILSYINVAIDGYVKAVTKVNCYSYVFAPWTNKTTVAAVDNEKTFSLPMKLQLTTQLRNPAQIVWAQVTPKLELKGDSIPIIKVRNVPFTAIGGIHPSTECEGPHQFKDLKVVKWHLDESQWPESTYKFSEEATGLNAYIRYKGEPLPPGTQSNYINYLRDPSRLLALLASPSIKSYDLSLNQPNDKPPTRSIGAFFRMLEVEGEGEEIRPESAKKPADCHPLDTVSEREQKLKQFSRTTNYEFALSVNFTGDGEPKVYEASLITAEDTASRSGKSSDEFYNVIRKFQVSMLSHRSDPSKDNKTCFVFAQVKPQLTPMESLGKEDENIQSDMQATIYQGRSCSSSQEPVVSSEATLRVSKDRLDELHNITGDLHMSQGNSSLFYQLAVYDRLEMKLSWTNPSTQLKNYSLHMQDLVEGYFFPNVVKNRLVSNEAKKMTAHAKRYLGDNRVNARVSLPNQDVEVQNLKISPLFDPLVTFSPSELQSKVKSRSHLARYPTRGVQGICSLTHKTVQTFDGVLFERALAPCETLLVQGSSGPDTVTVYMKESSENSPLEVLIYSRKESLYIQIKGSTVKINGEVTSKDIHHINIRDPTDKTIIGKLIRVKSGILLDLFDKLILSVKGKELSITMKSDFSSKTYGLCGDNNGESSQDMRGPHGCIFKPENGDIFTASWLKDEQCEIEPMPELLKQLEEYRNTCPKKSERRLSTSNCPLNNVYPMNVTGDVVCVSKVRLPHCPMNCRPKSTKKQLEDCKCWKKEHAPASVQQSIRKGYMNRLPKEEAEFENEKEQIMHLSCEKRPMQRGRTQDNDCYLDVYPILPMGSELCVSQESVQMCNEQCEFVETDAIEVMTECWQKDEAPQDVKENQRRGYVTTRPKADKSNSRLTRNYVHAHTSCSKMQF